MKEEKKLPEFKSKPIIGVPEEEWHKWTMGKIAHWEAMQDPYIRKKMSNAAKERHKNGWACPNRYEWTVDDNPNKGGLKGEENPVYGKGGIYKELTTGFTGVYSEHVKQFPGFGLGFVNRKRIRKDSPYPNYKWIRLNDDTVKGRDRVVHFTPEQVIEMKNYYLQDLTLTLKDLEDKYKVHIGAIKQALKNEKVYNDPKYGEPIKLRRHSIQTCPHCGYQGGGINYTRWHGDNCKKKLDFKQ